MNNPSVVTLEYTDISGETFVDGYENGRLVCRLITRSTDSEYRDELWFLRSDGAYWVKESSILIHKTSRYFGCVEFKTAPRSPAHPIFSN